MKDVALAPLPKGAGRDRTRFVTGLTKQRLRSKILSILKTQKEEDRKRKSRLIEHKLFLSPIFKRAKTVMFYMSFDGEVDTTGMIKRAQKLGKKIAVPVCVRDRIMMRPAMLCDRGALRLGPYGIHEPVTKELVRLGELDVVVVPGVAFDTEGRRLGRGKGYYDRFLKRLPSRTRTIGIAFDFQILPVVPTVIDDMSVDRVIFA